MNILMSGRRIGRSVFAQMWNEVLQKPFCQIITSSIVDGRKFLTIQSSKEISNWVRSQGNEKAEWFEHIDHNWNIDRNKFDVSEEFYLMLKLRWGC